ncbi:MAG: nucleotide exchange factor GrpE [Candidatus Uhrbacteria bacterium]|nr:nucleotide exchange factor GrpE [Candidatus Uhrbacteria bacterium]
MNEEQKEEGQQPTVDGQSAGEGNDISKLTAERDEYLDGWKRAKADYDNLVRDTERKRSEFADWATERVLTQLIPALDQYEVALKFTPALDAIPVDQRRPFENWIVGLEAVRSLWWDAAKDLGLERVRITGAFDPTLHEAVGEESSDTVPAGEIIRATMNGYLLKGKLIRPAKVVVSKSVDA